MRGWKVWIEPSGRIHRCRWKGIYGTGQRVFNYKEDAADLKRSKTQDFQRMSAGLPPTIRPSVAITVAQYAATYLENSKREKSPKTYQNFDKPAIESFVEMYGPLAMAAITDKEIREWKYALAEKYKDTTQGMLYAQLCAFFNASVKADILTVSPARHVKKPMRTGGGRELRDDELTVLMGLAPDVLYRTGTFSLNTLLRINEVVMFDWSWTWEIEGKRGRALMGKIPANLRKTKSKVKEDCIFPINKAARAVMGPRRLSGRVFPWSATTIQHQMFKTRRAAKLSDDITFHCFRHTGASRFLREEGHMEDLLKSHVWDDPRSLLAYVHLEEKTLHRRFSSISYPYLAPNCKPARQSPKGRTGR